MLIIHATNVHQGGGRSLLESLLAATGGLKSVALLDARFTPAEFPPAMEVISVPPTGAGRLKAEWRLKRLTHKEDLVLCFGNLPPLLNITGRIKIFLQNRYLFGKRDLSDFPLTIRFRIMMERSWFKARLKDRMEVLVQTPSMARALERETGVKARVISFFPPPPASELRAKHYDFLYVATGESHKNHRRLLEAWQILANEGLYPTLCLTLDPKNDRGLLNWIESRAAEERMRIENAGPRPIAEMGNLYMESRALIYPSLFESFGLPLLEASAAGIPVLAGELDYVRDVSVPLETFDPHSAVSIARAVKRHLGLKEQLLTPLSPGDFLKAVLIS